MERSRGMKNGLKAVATALFLAAALVSTGCGQNALMNPTADQVAAGGDVNQAGNTTVNMGGQGLNPGGQGLNP